MEDGISHPATRVRMGYGGGDITQAFHWLLQKCAFPYKTCDPLNNQLDAVLLEKLKQDTCHVNLDVCGCSEISFTVRQPKVPTIRYTIQVTGNQYLFFSYVNCPKKFAIKVRFIWATTRPKW